MRLLIPMGRLESCDQKPVARKCIILSMEMETMPDRDRLLQLPSREEVEAKLEALIAGRTSREDIASWAAQWVNLDDPPRGDSQVWSTLTILAGADMISTDRPYLYSEVDFRQW